MYSQSTFFLRLWIFILILIAYYAFGLLQIAPFVSVCLFLFYCLTTGIVERCLFLIATVPLWQCNCPGFGIYISYVDILSLVVLVEGTLIAYKKIRDNKVNSNTMTILLLIVIIIAAILSSLIGIRSVITYGALARFIILATTCAIISNVLFFAAVNDNELGDRVLKVVALQLIFFVIWYLCLWTIQPDRLTYGQYESIFAGNGRLLVSNDLATFFCMSIPCMFAFDITKRFLGMVLIFSIYVVLLVATQSRGGLVVFVFFMFMFGIFQRSKKKFYFILLLIVCTPIAGYYGYDVFEQRFIDYQNEYRFDLIKTYFTIFFDHPVFGIGWGAWIHRGDLNYISNQDIALNAIGTNAHNMYLSVMATGGIVFTLPFLTLFVHWLNALIRTGRNNTFTSKGIWICNSQIALIGLLSILLYGLFADMSNSPLFWITISIIPTMTVCVRDKAIYIR